MPQLSPHQSCIKIGSQKILWDFINQNNNKTQTQEEGVHHNQNVGVPFPWMWDAHPFVCNCQVDSGF